MFKRLLIIGILIILASCICLGAEDHWPTNGWKESTPEDQGMDSKKLTGMLNYIYQQDIAIHSIIVVRHGRLVLESYQSPYNREKKHPINSCTKSIVSALVGIAMKDGYLTSVDQKVKAFFPSIDKGMEDVTLKHLLSMSSGMDWPEISNAQFMRDFTESNDWTQYVLNRPMVDPVGTKFNYNSGGSHLFSAIMTKMTGKSVVDYAQERLFGPLGIKDLEWERDSQGMSIGGWGLRMLPVDMAKFGYLYLKNGFWEGKEVVPAGWIRESTRKQIETTGDSLGQHGYGYHWWINEFGGYHALGFAGQYIFVVPEKDLVVVFTSDLVNGFQQPRNMMKSFIIPAVLSEQPLKPNPQGVDAMKSVIKKMAEG